MSQAQDAIAAGETRTAEIHLRNLLDDEPNHVLARVLLGEVSLAAGKSDAAEQNFRTALELGGDASVIQLPLLQSLLSQEKLADVLSQIESGPELPVSSRMESLMIQAAAHRGLGSMELAESAYQEALAIQPGSAHARSELAALLLESGRAAEARTLIASVLADEPDFVPALILHGNFEWTAGQNEEAERAFQRAVELNNASGARSGPLQLSALSQLIETQIAQDKLAEAAANADSLLVLDTRSPVGRFLKAKVEAAQNDLENAKDRLLATTAEFPEYWPAHALLGAISARQGLRDQATMYLRAALNSNPTDRVSRLLLVELYIRDGNLRAARRLLEDAELSGSPEGLFLALAGRASMQAGEPDLASAYFDRSEQRGTSDPQRLVTLTRVYLDAGEFERAIRVLESAPLEGVQGEQLKTYLLALVQLQQGDVQAATATASRFIERYPESAWPLNLRGAIALRTGDLTGAQFFFSKALERDASDVPALLNLARVAIALNDKAGAAERLHAVLKIDPNQPTALLGLAQLAADRGDLPEALRWLQRAPETAARLALEGSIQFTQRDFDAAATSFSQAFSREPSAALAMYAYVAARSAGRQAPEADLVAWSASNPQDQDVNFQLASIALANGNADEAIRRYETLRAADGKRVAALNNLAWLYDERGDDRALELAEQAHAMQPENPAVADTLGWIRVRRGEAAEGLLLLEQAATQLPQEPDVRYHWAVALSETGDRQRALEVLRDLLATAGDFKSRAEAENRYSDLQGSRIP